MSSTLHDAFTFYVANPDLAAELLGHKVYQPEFKNEYAAARDALVYRGKIRHKTDKKD